MGELTLILGGARSGKSSFAQKLAQESGGRVVYLATAEAQDAEMAARIAAHRAERPSSWHTLEIPHNIGAYLQRHPLNRVHTVLLDCLTLLVSNVVLKAGPEPGDIVQTTVHTAVAAEVAALQTAIDSGRAQWVVVSNEVGLGLVPAYALGRVYRDELGWANQQLARQAGTVYFMVAGMPMRLQPER